MRRVNRTLVDEPPSLSSRNRAGLTEQERARNHQANPDPKKGSFEYAAYKDPQVKERLKQLFHGKCAYCETFFSASAPVDVEHYRPKGSVSEAPGHGGYWWLAMSWDNLLPSCIDCNRKRGQEVAGELTSLFELYDTRYRTRTALPQMDAGKQDSFPLRATGQRLLAESADYHLEMPLLLDPTRDDPRQHLRFHVDQGALSLVLPGKTPGKPCERGATSIQVYGLNRLGLVQERTRVLRQLEFLGDLVLELGEISHDLRDLPPDDFKEASRTRICIRLDIMQKRALAEIRSMARKQAPYSEMVRAWLTKYLEQLGA